MDKNVTANLNPLEKQSFKSEGKRFFKVFDMSINRGNFNTLKDTLSFICLQNKKLSAKL